MKLEIGDLAPDFDLPATAVGERIKLSDLRGKNVVIYFYPKDDTPGCTMETKAFSLYKQKFSKLNTIIIGVSKDSLESHCKFQDKYGFNINLASDIDGKVCEQYGVWQQKSLLCIKYMGIVRSTFLINQEGKIVHIWPKVRVIGHIQDILKLIEEKIYECH